ncbi:capsular biosynthesis protein [Vibrio navarrensis]|nr:capsular biosynthesis protein [Vibrio navarrensis]
MIIIPMAGLSSRFFKAGFTQPKYMLEARGESLFEHAVKSFQDYFREEKFLFIIRDVHNTRGFVDERVRALGILDYDIVTIEHETRGQAETVFIGLNSIDYSGSITIFNIDTFRPNFKYPLIREQCDGYLEVFSGEGDNWSFVRPKDSVTTEVVETAEKSAISNLCCTGLYYFSKVKYFFDAYNEYSNRPKETWVNNEIYIAPLYNYLISRGYAIHYNLIHREEVIFCGVPQEYYEFTKL